MKSVETKNDFNYVGFEATYLETSYSINLYFRIKRKLLPDS